MYVYVGENGYEKTYNYTSATYRFNGGGYGNFACYKHYLDTENNPNYGMDYAGGGATDIRLENGNWNNFESLKSRIMVAAGSGGTAANLMYKVSNGGGAKIGMPSHSDNSIIMGNSGNGYARITLVGIDE